MINLIRSELFKIVEDIDAGNSHITEDESVKLLKYLKELNSPYMSKYQAYTYLGISRASFDNLIRDGKLPHGIKVQGFKELMWLKKDITSRN